MNNELLKNICEDIYKITGIKPVVYDAEMQGIYAHPLAMEEFCRLVRRDPERKRQCLACDRAGFEQCRKSRDLHIYRCHMGLTEAVAPILDRGSVIGYLLFGQLLSEGAEQAAVERIASGDFADREALLSLLAQMEPIEEEKIRASARLMAMCTSYVHFQEALKHRRSEAASMLDEYISTHLSEDLSADRLCRIFSISRGTLYAAGEEAFGKGIAAHVRERRLAEAVRLLRETDWPVYQIGEAVGISDANYLTKLVKAYAGKTPSEVRRKA